MPGSVVATKENGKLVDGENNEWILDEHRLIRLKNQQELFRLPGHLAYWFGWYAFFPNSEVYEAKQ